MTEALMFPSIRALVLSLVRAFPLNCDVLPLLFPETRREPRRVTRTSSVVYPQTESLKYNWKQTAASPGLLSSGESWRVPPGVGSAPWGCRAGVSRVFPVSDFVPWVVREKGNVP